jgi:hypothetical protein
MTVSNLSKVIDLRLSALSFALRDPLGEIADLCGETFDQPARLNQVLTSGIQRLESCALVYVINPFGIQMSGNVGRSESDEDYFGQDLSERTWFRLARENREPIFMSDVYISRPENAIGITAVHRITSRNGTLLGYLCADFLLRNLPLVTPDVPQTGHWKRIAGDPTIRDLMYHQERNVSDMERQFDDLKIILHDLVTHRGIFHFKLHFSSSRATLWCADDPMRYRVHVLDEIIQPSICLAYNIQPPLEESCVSSEQLEQVLNHFHQLRTSDPYLYLRAASLNTVNGLVGLNLSWDSQHFVPVDQFLASDTAHWIGADNVWFGDDVSGARAG